MGGGLGRAQGAYDEMVFRAKVRDDAKFFTPVGLESEGTQIDFQIGVNDYLYGTRFYNYLAYAYSPEKVIDWMRRGKDSKAYYANQFEQVFGKPLDDAWQDWIRFEHDFQRENLKTLAQYPATPVTVLSKRALGSVSKSYYDEKSDTLFGAFRYPGVIAHVGALSFKDGTVRRLANINGPALYGVASLAYDPEGNRLWYTVDNKGYRDLMQIDIATGDKAMLIRDGRIGGLSFDSADRSLWGLRHQNGLATLVRLDPPYTGWREVHAFAYGEIPSDLDVSADGKLLCATVSEIDGDQRVNVYRIADLMNGQVNPIAALRLEGSYPEGGTFSKDGRFLYASAYYTGVSNVYRLDLENGKIDAVSNATTGFFRPIARDDGNLIVLEYTGEGFRPVLIDPKPVNDLGTIKFLGTENVAKHPFLKTLAVGSPARVPIDQLITERGEYIPQKELRLDSTYPVVQGYKGHVGFGWYINFEDPPQFNQLQALVSYSPAGDLRPWEALHATVSYHTVFWHVRYWHNDANFYDLFGPTDRSRKGDALLGGYRGFLILDPTRQMDFTVDGGLFTGLDTLPGAQNVHTADKQIAEVKFGMTYLNMDRSLGAIDYEAGYGWNFTLQDDYARNDNFPKARGGFDFGLPLPWNHSSLWLYSSAGIAAGAGTNPLNDFFFGAFGNNYVDNGEVKRYRTYDSFPGFKIDEVGARSFLKSVAEWNLPPIRFEEIGIPSFYLGSIRSAVFGGMLSANPGAMNEHELGNVGFQLDLNFTVALYLPMTFSVGYAHGFGDSTVHGREEILASLKIL
jgi:sugar lactone lactonase YvrE